MSKWSFSVPGDDELESTGHELLNPFGPEVELNCKLQRIEELVGNIMSDDEVEDIERLCQEIRVGIREELGEDSGPNGSWNHGDSTITITGKTKTTSTLTTDAARMVMDEYLNGKNEEDNE